MRVTCPNCAAGYEVPDHLLAAGTRTLRCARCGTTFQAGPAVVEPPAPVEPVTVEPPPEPPPALAFPRAPPAPLEPRVVFHPPMIAPARPARMGRRTGAAVGAAGWLLTVLLLAGAAVGAIQSRERIIAAWPASARAYGAVGLNPAAAAAPAPATRPPAARTSSAGP